MKLTLKQNSKLLFSQFVILLLLVMGTINVGNLFFYFIILAFCACMFFNRDGLRINGMFVLLMLFSLLYIVCLPSARGSYTTIIKQFVYPMCYLIGMNFAKTYDITTGSQRRTEHAKTVAIIALAIAALLHYLLNMLLNIDNANRNTTDIWTGEVLSATGQAGLAVIAVGVFSALIFSESKKIAKGLSICGFIIIFAYNTVLAGRTIIFLSAIVLATALLYALKIGEKRRRRKVYISVVLVFAIIIVIYKQNMFGVRDWILESNFSKRFETLDMMEDSRITKKIDFFKNMLNYPFGGGHLYKAVGGYAHELYLDVYSDVGIVGYFIIISFVIFHCVQVLKLQKSQIFSRNFKMLVLCVYLAILIEFFLEPIIQGMPWMFCTFCFYSGLLCDIGDTRQRGSRYV